MRIVINKVKEKEKKGNPFFAHFPFFSFFFSFFIIMYSCGVGVVDWKKISTRSHIYNARRMRSRLCDLTGMPRFYFCMRFFLFDCGKKYLKKDFPRIARPFFILHSFLNVMQP